MAQRNDSYTPDDRHRIVQAVADAVSDGALIADACHAEHVAPSTVRLWVANDAALSAIYVRARSISARSLEDSALSIAAASTSESYQRDRLEIDTLKWAAAKRNPRDYGDKVQHEVGGSVAHLHLDALRATPEAIAHALREATIANPLPRNTFTRTGAPDDHAPTRTGEDEEAPHSRGGDGCVVSGGETSRDPLPSRGIDGGAVSGNGDDGPWGALGHA